MDGVGRKDAEQFTRVVQAGIARGMDVVDAWRVARSQRPSADSRALQAEHDRAARAFRKETSRYVQRQRQLQTQVTVGASVAGVAGTVGVIDVITEAATSQAGVYGPSWMWLSAAVIGGITAVFSRRAQRAMPPPPRSFVPPAPPPALSAQAIGAHEARELTALRLRLAQVIPAIATLHPGAADELRRADLEAAPPLHALVERLAVLDRIRREMPGTSPGEAATSSAVELRERLAVGCQTYERLLAASATMLAAPDIARSTEDVLGPALTAMSAYAHGLQRSADTFRP